MPKGGKTPAESNGVLPKLKEVYEFMTQHNLETLEIKEAGLHLKMVRRRTPQPQQIPVPVMMQQGAVPQQHSGGAAATAPPVAGHAPGDSAPAGASTIKSTMMGIFYRAPSPSSPPFIKEGEKVKVGQLLCMIEAMKVFNEIKAEFPFTVLKVLLENGKPVKSGQDLFLIQRN